MPSTWGTFEYLTCHAKYAVFVGQSLDNIPITGKTVIIARKRKGYFVLLSCSFLFGNAL